MSLFVPDFTESVVVRQAAATGIELWRVRKPERDAVRQVGLVTGLGGSRRVA